MAKKQPQTLQITTQPGQISAPGGELANFLPRGIVPSIINPQWQSADLWRAFVKKQPIAMLCRDAIASYLLSLDWAIVAADVNDQDNLKEDIKYYTKLLERGNAYYYDIDFSAHIEWVVRDLFDLPFGAASEYSPKDETPDGRVVWIRPLDAGTLDPTLDKDFPIMQSWPSLPPVYFPRNSVSRVYLSPRTEIRREGWGMAPPEKIYLAMEMLNRGDTYYAKLLLDTPAAGILDLLDMEETDAKTWIKSMQDLMFGISPLKIPVLYQHTSAAQWIPFERLPTEILYDSVTSRYITILTAGYGLSPSDIGFPSASNGGETLAGTIRQERRSARSGKAVAKKKTEIYWNQILPDTLRFKWIDSDDERAVAMSRARMANANAFNLLIQNRVFEPGELRRQSIADGLITISVPETIDINSKDFPPVATPFGGGNKLSNQIGKPVAPSSGGQGDALPQQIISKNRSVIEPALSKAIFSGNKILGALINSVRGNESFSEWEIQFDKSIVGKSEIDDISKSIIDDTLDELKSKLGSQKWIEELSEEIVKSIISKDTYTIKAQLRDEFLKLAEDEFIAGQREDITLSSDEEEKLLQIDLSKDFHQLKAQIMLSLVDSISTISLLISKNEILEYKFDIDVTEVTDNNTLKLARNVSAKVFDLLPKIVNELYLETSKSLISEYGKVQE